MYVVCLVWEEYTIGKSKGKKKISILYFGQ